VYLISRAWKHINPVAEIKKSQVVNAQKNMAKAVSREADVSRPEMGKGRKRNKNKCRFIEDEADLSGDGHSDDDLSNDEEELQKQRLFVDDSVIKEKRRSYSPVHESEEELDSDDLALVEENNEDTVVVRKRCKTRPQIESSEDEHDSMDDFIEHDTDDEQVVVDRVVKTPAVKRIVADPPEKKQQTARPLNVRRPVHIMPSYSNFRTPHTETKPQNPVRTWEFMRKQQTAKQKPPPQQPGYVRSADGLKYRKVDGTLVAATGVDRV
jgi:hypothetical protein